LSRRLISLWLRRTVGGYKRGRKKCKMFFVYVLKSLRNCMRYTGFTGKFPEERLREHNNGNAKWTKLNGPFKLIYVEEYRSKVEARKREIFLKSGQGRNQLDDLLK